MLEIQFSSRGEQKFFIFIRQKNFYIYFVLKKYGQVSAIFTDTDTTSRYHKNRLIPPIPILKYRYITTLDGVNKQYVDERFNNVFSDNIDLHGTHKIVNLSDPTDPTNSANKQYADDHFSSDLNLNNNRITGSADPIDDHDAATKIFVPQPAYGVYKVFCNSENREIQLTHLSGKNNLYTLYNNNVIGLTDISSGNVLRISISGSAINNTSGTLASNLLNLPEMDLLKY